MVPHEIINLLGWNNHENGELHFDGPVLHWPEFKLLYWFEVYILNSNQYNQSKSSFKDKWGTRGTEKNYFMFHFGEFLFVAFFLNVL